MNVSNAAISPVVTGRHFEVGSGFKAKAFREKDFDGAMGPLMMADHYTMVEPTFGAHPHAGLAAVSLLFEDSQGKFHNQDSLGNDFDLMPGDLYWLQAGAGVEHDESPRAGSKIHGLQVFVKLPEQLKQSAPESLYVAAQDIPIIERDGSRIRVVLGESNGVRSQIPPALPMTILDGRLAPGSTYSHTLSGDESAWLYAARGELQLRVADQQVRLSQGQAVVIESHSMSGSIKVELANGSEEGAGFALFSAPPVK